jgi:molybdopterin-synthase adenylyltransferase
VTGLSSKRVLLIGAGGLGSPVATLLGRAGVGYVEVLDDDVIEASNLQRQTLYTAADVGQSKARIAAQRLMLEAQRAGHESTRAVAREARLEPDTALDAVRGFDLVVDGADNYPSKFLTADACMLARVACVQAGAVRWVGWALGTMPGSSACLRCTFEDIPAGPDRGCATAGVVGPVVGVVGALQASLALRILLGDSAAAGTLLHYRGLSGQLRGRQIKPSKNCPACTGEIRSLDAARYAPEQSAA